MKIPVLLLAISLFTCYSSKNQQKQPVSPETRRGLLIAIGSDTEYYFIQEKNGQLPASDLVLSDTNTLAFQLFDIFKESMIDSAVSSMKRFAKDVYRCGEWADRNQLKYCYAELEVLNNEAGLNEFWKERHNRVSELCIFDPQVSKHFYLRFRIPAIKVKKVRVIR